MGAVWSALLVGGALAGALFVWLLWGKGKKGSAEEEDAALGKAAAGGGDRSGGGGPSPGPSRRELVTKPGILPLRVPRADLPGAVKLTEGGKGPPGAFLAAHFQGLPFPTRGGTLPVPSISHAGAGQVSRPLPRPWRCPDGASKGGAPLRLRPLKSVWAPLGGAWCSAGGYRGGGVPRFGKSCWGLGDP